MSFSFIHSENFRWAGLAGCKLVGASLFALFVLHLTGCGAPSVEQHSPQAVHRPEDSTTAVPAPAPAPRSYTWAAARTGSRNVPRLRAMMLWYATQAENLRQTDFIEGQPEPGGAADDGPPPLPKGPYEVNFQSVDDYLATLKKWQ